ncbi:hypothetical protein [Curtobacterium sp. MCJR17_043]|uniref:hypothetical protein n=1 Tax=Curtobacterium sp. MCJR17_043 TaxID=2175660 RepID=UPI0024DF65C2|nr:hypothetical protein [Curtobacterium sp. MCJR17_043]WIB37210.1 hypothetical protein DEJ15_15395 [Curtobacterium sp. MCJR17_043]
MGTGGAKATETPRQTQAGSKGGGSDGRVRFRRLRRGRHGDVRRLVLRSLRLRR